jgi:predicted O-methyltransferase YrrM
MNNYELIEEFNKQNFTPHSFPKAIGLWPNEQQSLAYLALQANPNYNWLEIGSFCGGSTIILAMAKGKPKVYSVDRMREVSFDINIQSAGLADYIVKLDIDTLDLTTRYNDGPLSLVFIDGWHSFKGAYQDFLAVEKFLTKDAIVLFHDTIQQPYKDGVLEQQYNIAIQYYDSWMTEILPNKNPCEQTYNLDAVIAYIIKKHRFRYIDNIPVLDGSTNCLAAISPLV